MVSTRTRDLGTEKAFDVLGEVKALQRAGKDIVSFCIGQPDFDTPKNIKEAGIKAIQEGKTDYTPSAGIYALRKAIAEYHSNAKGIDLQPEDVIVGCGGKPFIGISVLATTDFGKGDEVIYPNPGYPIYESQIIVHGAKPVPLHLLEEKRFEFDINELRQKISKKTRLLMINTPQNPTGGILSKDILAEIAELANKHDFYVFADEIYSRLCYDGKFESIMSFPGMDERTIILDGMSKIYAMTGWRIGYAITKPLSKYFANWINNIESCAAHPNQLAALEAITGPQDESEKMIEIFKQRRDLIVKLLNELPGVKCLSPGGAFYAYPNITELCKLIRVKNAEELRLRLLNEAGLAVLADIHFGQKNPSEGEHLRLSYATSTENIREGLNRFKEFIDKNTQTIEVVAWA